MDQKKIREFTANEFLPGHYFLVRENEICHKKSGEPYLRLLLTDGSQTIKAFIWEDFGDLVEKMASGTVVKIQGAVRSYRGELSLTIQKIRCADPDQGEPSIGDFALRSEIDIVSALSSIEENIDSITSPYLKTLLGRFFLAERYRDLFIRAPAAKNLHHNTVGGLLEHTISVAAICDFFAHQYPVLNRDLLMSAALLHDIGKLAELHTETFDYTDQGRLLGHLILGIQMIDEESGKISERREQEHLELIHAILAHHGTPEWGSPVTPMTLEAVALHYADNLDAKMTSFQGWIESNPDPARESWSRYWPFMERFLYHRRTDTPEDAPE